jgi:hypothetical protein
MSQKRLEIEVLRAALRCARHRRTGDRAALLLRVDCSEPELERALERLAGAGLVRSADDPRLTLEGLAVAVASLRPFRAAPKPVRARTAA